MDMDHLYRAARALPQGLRDEWHREIRIIRGTLAGERRYKYISGVSWDDPEYVAKCAIKLAEFQVRVQNHINRFGGS